MAWVAIGGAVAGSVANKVLNKPKSGGSSQPAAQAANQQSWSDINQVNALNRDNATWAQQQNQASVDRSLGQNRVNQTSDFGGVTWDQDPTTGSWSQTSSVAPEQQAMLGALRGKQSDLIGGMGGSFDVNSDVMNAYRGVNQPLVDQQRNKENARLAAMGLGSGSGSAWGNSQDALNRNQVNSDQNAILQGFNADQSLRSSNRADLAGLNATETGWQNNMQQPSFAQASAPIMSQSTVATPENRTWEAEKWDLNKGAYDQAVQRDSTGKIISGIADKLPNVIDWWNQPGQPDVRPTGESYNPPTEQQFMLDSQWS